MRNVQGATVCRYNKARLAFNLSLKVFNLALKLQQHKITSDRVRKSLKQQLETMMSS